MVKKAGSVKKAMPAKAATGKAAKVAASKAPVEKAAKSPGKKVAKRETVVSQELAAALNSLTPAVRQIYDAHITSMVQTDDASVFCAWDLGNDVKNIMEDPEKYGVSGVVDLARAMSFKFDYITSNYLHQLRAFATKFTYEEVATYLERARTDLGRPMTKGIFFTVLPLTSSARKKMLEKYLAEDLSIVELRAQCNALTSSHTAPEHQRLGGRPQDPPADPVSGLRAVRRSALTQTKYLGFIDEYVVKPLLQHPHELTVDDLAALEETEAAIEAQVDALEAAAVGIRTVKEAADKARKMHGTSRRAAKELATAGVGSDDAQEEEE